MEQEIVEVYHNVVDGIMTLEEFVEWVETRESNVRWIWDITNA